MPLTGHTLKQREYRLLEVLGEGTTGTVYRASRRSFDEAVAVKVLHSDQALDHNAVARFMDEYRRAAWLDHPNLIGVHDVGREGDLVYLVMDLAKRGTLRERLVAGTGRLGVSAALQLIDRLASALDYLHERGVVHLDVKPANVLLARDDWPLLSDFGIARLVRDPPASTAERRVLGTPAYMAPEQCRSGQPADGRSDQYALAVVAFELLVGRRPFVGATIEQVLRGQAQDPPPWPSSLEPRLPLAVDRVLLRALSKAPESRFPTVRDFARALSLAASELSSGSGALSVVSSVNENASDIGTEQTIEQTPKWK